MATVDVSALIRAPLQQVWKEVRDFNALPNWHPMIVSSEIEGGLPSTTIGCIRNFRLADGTPLREQLLGLCDVDHRCTYSIVEASIPVRNYVATLSMYGVTEGDGTFARWNARFDIKADLEVQTVGLVTTIFREGLKHLDQIIGVMD